MTTVKRARAVMEVWWGRMRIPKGITKAVRWKLFRFSSELKLSLSPGLVNLEVEEGGDPVAVVKALMG